jgi:hypothetical protein
MTPTNTTKFLLTISLVALGVGLADAAVGGDWDRFVVMGIVLLSVGAVVGRASWHRPAVPLRSDLTSWLRERSEATGEPLGAVADRAVVSYRRDMGAA